MFDPMISDWIANNYTEESQTELNMLRDRMDILYNDRSEFEMVNVLLATSMYDQSIMQTQLLTMLMRQADDIIMAHFIELDPDTPTRVILSILDMIISLETIKDKQELIEPILVSTELTDREQGLAEIIAITTSAEAGDVLPHLFDVQPRLLFRIASVVTGVLSADMLEDISMFKRHTDKVNALIPSIPTIGHVLLNEMESAVAMPVRHYINLVADHLNHTDPLPAALDILSLVVLDKTQPDDIKNTTQELLEKMYEGTPLSISTVEALNTVNMQEITAGSQYEYK